MDVVRSCRPRSAGAVLALALVLALDLSGCAATRGRRGPPPRSGFLGDYSQLAEAQHVQLGYANPAADWSRYQAVELDSVTMWTHEGGARLDAKERQMATDLLYTALHEELGRRFVLVDEPRADALRIRAALTSAQGANVALRTVSSVVPQMLVLSTVTGLSADAATTVGSASVEMEAVDAVTGERLAAAVDSRAGTKNPLSGRTYSKWGDVEAASRFWARRVAAFLAEQGVQQKPGAPPLEP